MGPGLLDRDPAIRDILAVGAAWSGRVVRRRRSGDCLSLVLCPRSGDHIVATDDSVESDIPERVLQIFRDENARPKVTRTYDVQVGWLAEPALPVLTWRTVDELIERGKTSVDLKWRSRRLQVSLLDLRPQRVLDRRPRRSESRALPPQG